MEDRQSTSTQITGLYFIYSNRRLLTVVTETFVQLKPGCFVQTYNFIGMFFLTFFLTGFMNKKYKKHKLLIDPKIQDFILWIIFDYLGKWEKFGIFF